MEHSIGTSSHAQTSSASHLMTSDSTGSINLSSTSNNSISSSSSTSDPHPDLSTATNLTCFDQTDIRAGAANNLPEARAHNYMTVDSDIKFSTIVNLNQHQQLQQQQLQHSINQAHSSPSSSSSQSVFNSALDARTDLNREHMIGSMNVESSNHGQMVPAAHSDNQVHYSLQTAKHLTDSSRATMALNFSHDLLQQTNHHHNHQDHHNHHQGPMHQNHDNNEVKPNVSSFDLGSGSSLMQSAVNMNVWKSTMGLNQFRHPSLGDHNFTTPNHDPISFSSWPHTNNLSHQPTSMAHHILDGPHLIGYPNQRPLSLSGQDIGGVAMKGPTQGTDHTTPFMLNQINHQASSSQSSGQQALDNLNLRSHSLDPSASYNLSINDNQFYNSRSDSRSHPPSAKVPSYMTAPDKSSIHLSLNAHQPHMSYGGTGSEHNLQPTTSHMAGTSACNSSKNVGNFRCNVCSEVFSLRTTYQSHIRTHSNDKGSKAKFQCDLCGHSFSQKTSLNRHMKSHTGERPFPCEICAKAFSEKERLKIHMRTHTGEKPFSCLICGKSFSQKSTVKRHQTVHTGEKKFKCDCGKGFANRGNLIAHIKTRGTNHFE